MKINKKALIAATAFTAAINLNGCVYGPPYDPADNVPSGVYGPPPVVGSQKTENSAEQSDDNSERSNAEADGINNTKNE